MKRYTFLLSMCFALVFVANAQKKKVINRADELPRRTLSVSVNFDSLYHNDALLDQFAATIYQNLTDDLAQYDIRDKSTLVSYYSSLLTLEYRAGKYDQLIDKIEKIRDLEDKEFDKLTTGLNLYAQLAAMEKHAVGSPAYYEEYGKHYLANLEKIPYEKIEQYVIDSRNRILMLNEAAVIAGLRGQLQPFFDNGKGQIIEQVILAIINTKFALTSSVKHHDAALVALDTYTAKYKPTSDTAAKVNIWADRTVKINEGAGQHVTLAIWDTGVDTSVFPKHLFTNTKEAINAKDDDNNGFVDDVHGIAFGIENERTYGDLQEAKSLRYSKDSLLYWTKGSMDLQYGVNSEAAMAIQRKVANIAADEAVPFREDLSWFGTYVHGTHVAGIAVEGNPYAKLLYTRISYETSMTPSMPTQERHERMVAMLHDIVAYWKQSGVRVVNISLRFSPYMYEALLNMHGIGENETERKALAQRWYQAEKAAMTQAFQSAPEILFICGAGNEANDAGFADYIPASLQLPNLLTIGAVNGEGKRTSFTTEGANIKLFANGYDIESYVPGGAKIRFNGTSMASPQVANLAAKMLAIHPQLTPPQIIDIVTRTATESPESQSILLIHPKRAIEQVLKLRSDYSEELVTKTIGQ